MLVPIPQRWSASLADSTVPGTHDGTFNISGMNSYYSHFTDGTTEGLAEKTLPQITQLEKNITDILLCA